MNMLAQPASAEALAGVQGRIVDNFVDMFVASFSAAACRFTASSVPIAVGWRNGKALLDRSSDSPGTSSIAMVVSFRRSRIVLRYSRDERRRSCSTPAALGSGGAEPPALLSPPMPGPIDPAVPVIPPPPCSFWPPIDPVHPDPRAAATQVAAA